MRESRAGPKGPFIVDKISQKERTRHVNTELIAVLISIISVSGALFFGLRNNKRADVTEIERKATETATINVKLDQIGTDVRDIKYDITGLKKDVQGLNERMIIVEQSTKSAHHRLDDLAEEKEK